VTDTDTLAPMLADLAAEHDSLDAVVAALDADAWDTATPAEGWAVRHQISHLTYFDEQAALAAVDPTAFEQNRDVLFADPASFDTSGTNAALDPTALLESWRAGRQTLLDAFTGRDPSERLPWYGPPMSARSFLTARLMESWAHGTDIAGSVGATLPATDRLRHIAHLGVVTRRWSFSVRGLEAPDGEVRVELDPPSGGVPWTWGPADAPDRVTASALDFCLVVTQRRHIDDSDIVATPGPAAEWMAVAQAFAGGATLPRGGR